MSYSYDDLRSARDDDMAELLRDCGCGEHAVNRIMHRAAASIGPMNWAAYNDTVKADIAQALAAAEQAGFEGGWAAKGEQ